MVRIGVISLILLCCTGVDAASIVADHRSVEDFERIPGYWVNQVKKMLLNYPGESHSRGMLSGLRLVEQQNSRFAVSIRTEGEPEGDTDQHLRVHKPFWSGSSWSNSAGEEDTWTNQAAIDRLNNHFAYSKDTLNNPFDVFVFGWCWDMIGGDVAGGVDPFYNTRWAGWSEGGPDGNLSWGLDAEDSALTGNSVSLQNYLDAWDYYEQNNPDMAIVYSTGPVDYVGERGYQRYLKHEGIRDWVNNDQDRILFDYGDILTYNNAGEQASSIWDGHTYPSEHPENDGDDNPFGYGKGHLGEEGYLKIGKAMWWLLARIAGWDGCYVGKGDVTGDCRVNMDDYAVMAKAWQSSPGLPNWNVLCDLSPEGGDGVVDVADLALLLEQWLFSGQQDCDLAGDITGDCKVDLRDLAVMAAAWQATPEVAHWNALCDLAPEGGDGFVDIADLSLLLEQWLFSGQQDCDLAGDITGDCKVDLRDLAAMAAAWHTTFGEAHWDERCDISPPEGDGFIGLGDLAVMVGQWLASGY